MTAPVGTIPSSQQSLQAVTQTFLCCQLSFHSGHWTSPDIQNKKNTGRDVKLSIVPMDGMHMRFALMLRVAWELYLRYGKDVNLGHIISSMPLNHGVFRPFNTKHPHQRWPATG